MHRTRRPVIATLILSLICAPLAAQEQPPAGGDDKVATAKEKARILNERLWNATTEQEREAIIAAIPANEVGPYLYGLAHVSAHNVRTVRTRIIKDFTINDDLSVTRTIERKLSEFQKTDPNGFEEWVSVAMSIKHPAEDLRNAATPAERVRIIASIPKYDLLSSWDLLEKVVRSTEATEVRLAALERISEFIRTRPAGSDMGRNQIFWMKWRLKSVLDTGERSQEVRLKIEEIIRAIDERQPDTLTRGLNWLKEKAGRAKDLMLSTGMTIARFVSDPQNLAVLAEYGGAAAGGLAAAGVAHALVVTVLTLTVGWMVVGLVAVLAIMAGLIFAGVKLGEVVAKKIAGEARQDGEGAPQNSTKSPEHSGVNETIKSIP